MIFNQWERGKNGETGQNDDSGYLSALQTAFRMLEELKQKNPEYQKVNIEVIEEEKEPEKTKGYDYWYVPTFFVDGRKVMEGVPTVEMVEKVLREALKS